MQNRIDILNELQTLSPLIGGINNSNVFTAPQGYFEGLAQNVLAAAKAETADFSGTEKDTTMKVPKGYFDTLADTILGKIKTQENVGSELKELSSLLHGISNKNIFTVPKGYFENLPGNILNKTVAARSALQEIKEQSAMLHDLQSKNVFTVPQGYFESLANEILQNVKPRAAKVVPMYKRTSVVLKYAVAAVFTGIMALGIFKFTNTDVTSNDVLTTAQVEGLKIANENRFEEELAKVGNEEIINFLTKEGVDVDAAVSVAEMEAKADKNVTDDDKTESNEIDELINQLDADTKMN